MGHPLGLSPGKIIATHLNFRGRAAERGRVPEVPSYFMKPSSSLSWSGRPVVRPAGCTALGFEGEIAIVIGSRARRVSRDEALSCVAGYAAADDFGLADFRHADQGSNLRAKGQDGFTPIGPTLLSCVDPSRMRLRAWVNGRLVQEACTDELLFPFDLLIADLSRHLTLEPGDVILSGTPAGAAVVQPGDVVEVELEDSGRLRNAIVAGTDPPLEYGVQPVTPAVPDREVIAKLMEASTATLSSQLRRRGIDHHVIEGVRPADPCRRMAGIARTLRYLPLREDVFARIGGGMNAQKRTVEALRPGEVLVIEARGDLGAGTLGDILALRALRRGAAGVVTDGGLRDSTRMPLPVYYGVPHPAVLGRRHVPMDSQVPITCGGALVMPGDVIVGDAEGVVVVPPHLAPEIAEAAIEQEREERFIHDRVSEGASIDGLYPMGPHWRRRYEQEG
ncbi:fumarylacetoacetate hydrolase family protein [Nonomuraea sediminis]|uniref:fumarylacetoacetate hydrolase family protein n=1 Tax=Nonomuraea sediminis TaxID=2835864 RepID=UPI001BDC2390|nr:fumarylacetoacetate hydrolase family protein [Nonomuraea sediminis]